MMYKAKVAVRSEILTKHSTQSQHHVEFLNVNLLNMKRRLLYLKTEFLPHRLLYLKTQFLPRRPLYFKTQSVPRSKHFPTRL